MAEPSADDHRINAEFRRLAALDSYRVLDTPPEAVFNDFVVVASQICGASMALISLVDRKRQWFKATLGFALTESSREIAFCAHAIESNETLVVEDATLDPRFANNPLVTNSPNLRFYAGTALRTATGEALGTLCVLDTRPRILTAQQQGALEALGRRVMDQLEFRRVLLQQREADEYHEYILNSAIDYAIITLDLEGRIQSWNEGAKRIFGWSREEAYGRSGITIFTPDDRAANVPDIEMGQALSRGRGSDERWHLRKDGSRFFASGEMMRLTDASDRPVGFLKIVRDRTHERRAAQTQAALLELGDRLRDFTDFDTIACEASEIMGRTLQASRAGYGIIDGEGDSIDVVGDWVSPGTVAMARTHRLVDFTSSPEKLLQGETISIDHWIARSGLRSDPLLVPHAYAQITLPVVEHGKTVAAFFVHSQTQREWHPAEVDFMREVASRTRLAIERRRAEHQVRQLAASLLYQVEDRTRERDRLWQLSRDPFLIADGAGRWLRVNPAWSEHLGWSEEELLGKTSEWMEHPEDKLRTREEVARVLAGEPSSRFENRFRDKKGDYHWFSWTAVATEGQLYCVARDVTAEKLQALALVQSEDRLRQAQKMDAIGQLTGGIAHDFNNLLAGILGSVSLMKRRLSSGRSEGIERFLDAAERSAKSAAALTERLLAFSRRQSLDAKAHDINQLVVRMEELLHRTVGAQIQIKSVLLADVWPALTDANQLENALLNLAINARDAMPDGGQITIETTNRTLDERYASAHAEVSAGDYVTIAVSDTGNGMTPAVIAQAFEPFFTTKPLGQGTGLGLSMVYGFVKQSAGHIRIHSELGYGTTVTLFLPRAPTSEEAEGDYTGIIPRAEGETVLVVEDEDTVRMLVTEVLEELGYAFRATGDPREALKLIESGITIDLLLTDVGLPHMNGRQLAEIAKAQRPALKILFLTGYAEQAAIRGGFLGPDMQLLTKPFAMDVLASKIREIFNGRDAKEP